MEPESSITTPNLQDCADFIIKDCEEFEEEAQEFNIKNIYGKSPQSPKEDSYTYCSQELITQPPLLDPRSCVLSTEAQDSHVLDKIKEDNFIDENSFQDSEKHKNKSPYSIIPRENNKENLIINFPSPVKFSETIGRCDASELYNESKNEAPKNYSEREINPVLENKLNCNKSFGCSVNGSSSPLKEDSSDFNSGFDASFSSISKISQGNEALVSELEKGSESSEGCAAQTDFIPPNHPAVSHLVEEKDFLREQCFHFSLNYFKNLTLKYQNKISSEY
ncbi:uncharacterized protein LOC135145015 [Zophobas morio]|uniref:uncharacterized protein LOC135145015 n=1 Tax=Zophobas morio TaxID=2755281 RepID=UPI0030829E9C